MKALAFTCTHPHFRGVFFISNILHILCVKVKMKGNAPGMVNKIRNINELTTRMQALGLSFKELAKFSGYNIKTLHNISSGEKQISPQLNAFLKVFEALHELGLLNPVLEKLQG